MRVQLEIPCSSEFVSVARKSVESLCSHLPLTKREVGDIELAVGEACTNAVKFSGHECAPVRLTCTLHPKALEITVRNRGPAFRIGKKDILMPPVDELGEGHMGLCLISEVMDDLKVTARNGLTTLWMLKKLREGSRK